MARHKIIVASVILLTFSAYAQQSTKPNPSRQQISDSVENGIIYYSCKVDPAFMVCAGFDPAKKYEQCVQAIRAESPGCTDSLRQTLPDFPTRDESRTYTKEYTRCVLTRVATSKGLLLPEVEKCANGSSTAP